MSSTYDDVNTSDFYDRFIICSLRSSFSNKIYVVRAAITLSQCRANKHVGWLVGAQKKKIKKPLFY